MTQEFIDVIRSAGLNPPSQIPLQTWVKFPGYDKSNGNKAGWAFLFDSLGGIYGDFSSDLKGYWRHDRVQSFTVEERINFENLIREAEAKAKAEQEREWAETALLAQSEWESATPADPNHPYLIKKNVKSYGLRQKDDALIIPLYDINGNITTLQKIRPDGSKKLMFHGKKKGSAFPIIGKTDIVFLCEGYATGASIHEATGKTVLVAIDAGNLMPVAELALTKNYGQIVIAADNDTGSPKNVGIDTAKKICNKHPSITFNAPPHGDWNDHVEEHGLEDAKSRLLSEPRAMTVEEAKIDIGGRGLDLPESIWKGVDLLELGMQAAREMTGSNIPQYSFPSIITHIATAVAGIIRYRRVHPSFFFVRIGKTSSNKTSTDDELKLAAWDAFSYVDSKGEPDSTFYGPNDFSSGIGLLRAVQKQPKALFMLDEITSIFTRQNKSDAVERGKIDAMLVLATGSNTVINRVYADTGHNIRIVGGVVNLTGNATPAIYKSFKLDDMETGLMQRFDFFAFDGKIPYYDDYDASGDAAAEFVSRLKELRSLVNPHGEITTKANNAYDVGMTDDALIFMRKFSRRNVDARNEDGIDEGLIGMISRAYDSTVKFALIHAVSTRHGNDIFKPIELRDVEWGNAMAERLLEWKKRVFIPSITAGDFDATVKLIVDGARVVKALGHSPTQALICNRRPRLKNLTPKQWDDAVKSAIVHGQIREVVKGKKSVYEPLIPE